ncbi:hypothetical protein CW304_21655 [Bacillus sp. UFRGS-B20]|nr:hypothetical protein CW304_21655 [Bacillus sp. UFRGS-B20]
MRAFFCSTLLFRLLLSDSGIIYCAMRTFHRFLLGLYNTYNRRRMGNMYGLEPLSNPIFLYGPNSALFDRLDFTQTFVIGLHQNHL